MNEPKIRFQGFEGEWEEKPLRNFFSKVTAKNNLMKYTAVLTNSAEHGIIDQRDFFDFDVANSNNIGGYYVVHPDDFVYNPRVSVTAPVGPINRNKLGYTGVMSPLYLVFKIDGINKDLLCHYFKTNKWHRFMRLSGNCGARFDRLSISDEQFVQMPINYPVNTNEQKAICNYLDNLDTLIASSSSRLASLKQMKAASLQAMFPQEGETVPKIRFKGFEGEWEKTRLGDMAPLQRGFDLPTHSICLGKNPVVYSNGIQKFHNVGLCDAPGLITGRSGTIGKFTYIESGKYWPHNTALWVTNFMENYPLFVFYLYQTIGIEKYATGSGVPTLNRNDVHKIKVCIPSLPEQQAIASYFTSLDKQIALLSQRLEKLKQIKSACLDKMFA